MAPTDGTAVVTPQGDRDILTLTERDGRTTLTVLVHHTERAHRDAHLDSGTEGGLQEGMELPERVAVSLG